MEPAIIETRLKYSLIALGAITISAVAAYFIWFGLLLEEPLSEDAGTWGEFGDYVGGLMNPLVAACALYWLTMSVRLQKAELSATRIELGLTRDELAGSRSMQAEQARIALIAAQLQTLNLKLAANTNALDDRRQVAAELRALIRTQGFTIDNMLEPGEKIDLRHELQQTLNRIAELRDEQKTLFDHIDSLMVQAPTDGHLTTAT